MFEFFWPAFNASDLVLLFDRKEHRKCLLQEAKSEGTRAARYHRFVAEPREFWKGII